MDETTFTMTAADGTKVTVDRYTPDGAPKAIVQIAHGMGEHAARYRRLAEALTAHGYVVYANDHRGHGRTAGSPDRHGDLGAGGWDGLVSDIGELGALARTRASRHPARRARPQHGVVRPAAVPARPQRRPRRAPCCPGRRRSTSSPPASTPTKEVDLSAFNAPFEPARTEYDWLSRDPAEVDAYVADAGVRVRPRPDGHGGDARRAGGDGRPGSAGRHRADLPDPTSSRATTIRWPAAAPLVDLVADRYREAGVADVTVARYAGARHEVFNETNRDEITDALIAWLDRVTAR